MKVLWPYDSLGRLQYEEREDWSGAAWVSKYSITQTYDKNGNRTGYNKAVSGSTADYGIAENLSYTFNAVNALTAITDAVETRYTCVVTCDANNNITQLDEVMSGAGTVPPFQNNHLYSIFEYDDLNRQTKHKTKAWVAGGTNNWVWVERQHEYSAVGALLRSGWRTYPDGTSPGAYSSSKHAYDQQTGNFVQNVATSGAPPAKGTRWVWAGAQNAGYGNLFGPNSDTASQNAYTVNASGGTGIPNRRTFINPSTEGDKRELWGQGRPMGKDSNTAWSTGTISQPANTHMNPVTSRLVFEGTVSSTDLSRITDMREKGRIGIFGTGFSYAGASGRVTSESIGRDLNPLGRGDGMAYVGGGQNIGGSAQNLGPICPKLPKARTVSGTGNSVNNLIGGSNDCVGCCQYQIVGPGISLGLWDPCLEAINKVQSPQGCGSPCDQIQCHKAICEMMVCLPGHPSPGRFWLPNKEDQQSRCHCGDPDWTGCKECDGGSPTKRDLCPSCNTGIVSANLLSLLGGSLVRVTSGNPVRTTKKKGVDLDSCYLWDMWLMANWDKVTGELCEAMNDCCANSNWLISESKGRQLPEHWGVAGLDPCCLKGKNKDVFECTRNLVCSRDPQTLCECSESDHCYEKSSPDGFNWHHGCYICLDTYYGSYVNLLNTFLHEISHLCGSEDPSKYQWGGHCQKNDPICADTIAYCVDLAAKKASGTIF
jgi:hypothetical protein